jgi:Xaa-Pro aminopeptidase
MRSKTGFDNTRRLEYLWQEVKALQGDGCLIENPVDLYYLTSLKVSSGSLLIKDQESLLLVDSRYLEACQKRSPFPVAHLQRESFAPFFKNCARVLFDSRSTSYERYLNAKKQIPHLVPISNLLRNLRALKDLQELKRIRQSAQLLLQAFRYLRAQIKEGIEEKELALKFELYSRKQGAEGLAFPPIIAFGENSAIPHHISGTRKLKKGDLILADLGLIVEGYRSDMTRVFSCGSLSPDLKKMVAIVHKAKKAALEICRPGICVGEVDQAARKIFIEEGVESLFLHSLGHGIGLETHEFPRIHSKGEDSSAVLKEGMVITIEPGLYVEGKGGVRLEDMIVVTSKGHENLSDAF